MARQIQTWTVEDAPLIGSVRIRLTLGIASTTALLNTAQLADRKRVPRAPICVDITAAITKPTGVSAYDPSQS